MSKHGGAKQPSVTPGWASLRKGTDLETCRLWDGACSNVPGPKAAEVLSETLWASQEMTSYLRACIHIYIYMYTNILYVLLHIHIYICIHIEQICMCIRGSDTDVKEATNNAQSPSQDPRNAPSLRAPGLDQKGGGRCQKDAYCSVGQEAAKRGLTSQGAAARSLKKKDLEPF